MVKLLLMQRACAALIMIALAMLLLYSWGWPGFALEYWNRADQWLFFTLNGWVKEPGFWQDFWAVTNNRRFDIVPGVITILLFIWHIYDFPPHRRPERLAQLLAAGLWIGLSIQLAKLTLDIDRESPSLLLEPVYRLSELVPWADPKDYSGHSFPSDRGVVLFIATGLLLAQARWRIGLLAVAGTLFFCMPRLVGGAHWFTDMAVGALSVALLTLSIALFTPAGRWVHKQLLTLLQIPWIAQLLRHFAHIG